MLESMGSIADRQMFLAKGILMQAASMAFLIESWVGCEPAAF